MNIIWLGVKIGIAALAAIGTFWLGMFLLVVTAGVIAAVINR